MRSTPWPNDTLRTVNEARVPPRCMPITTPSKIWMRSLSPSRTFTCTRTVSPDLHRRPLGQLRFFHQLNRAHVSLLYARAAFSSRSICRSSSSKLASSSRSGRRSSVRAQRFPLPPAPNLRVVARQQHVGHASALRRSGHFTRRPRVLRKIEQPAAERILHHRLLVADHARHEAARPRRGSPAPAARRRSARSRRSTAPRSRARARARRTLRSGRTAARRARGRSAAAPRPA